MKLLGNIVYFTTIAVCGLVLATSIYPGALDDLSFVPFLLFFFAIPIVITLGIILLLILILLAPNGNLKQLINKFPNVRIPWQGLGMIVAILLVSYILIEFNITCRLAFKLSQPAFEQMLVQAPVSGVGDMKLNRHLGLYHVDEYAADSRGGVYFRVYSSRWIFDIISYGFVYQPNSKGSPFGTRNYQTFHLSGKWYSFRDTTDWD
ncbi:MULTISPECIES: hypothetical protein [Calothrix]|uniref:Uncharacterized protein n=2 Tax=Calothrix TaxID=1186 RepID=A0ABR8A5F8_9CYAN|nr:MULTISPECIES: hypothetical protein [Calothrix]MBD2195212.1 hypothetical protein [Calothrix parietina FACHB-288]MBD2223817.1 hypothetical protein [Calothrix anomala FACHB-343]